MRGELLLLNTRSMTGFAGRVADHLRTFSGYQTVAEKSGLAGEMNCVRFADGEMEVEVRSSLRGKDVFLFAGCGRNGQGISQEAIGINAQQNSGNYPRQRKRRIAPADSRVI